MKYKLPKLPYAYNALDPYIDAKTMKIHHTKHHQAYIDKLNSTLEKYPELQEKKVEELLTEINRIPEDIRVTIRNHGGGHVNHSLFWQIMSPQKEEPHGKILEAIKNKFEGLEKFREQFVALATGRFGSGWAWLVLNKSSLEVYSTANQDSPLMEGKIPLLGLDVWEHAYYLKYQNRRVDYINSWWNIINWKKVDEFYIKAIKK